MRVSLQIFSIILVTLALTPALAHALELPGMRRLSQDVYVAVQKIYYPGFTLAASRSRSRSSRLPSSCSSRRGTPRRSGRHSSPSSAAGCLRAHSSRCES